MTTSTTDTRRRDDAPPELTGRGGRIALAAASVVASISLSYGVIEFLWPGVSLPQRIGVAFAVVCFLFSAFNVHAVLKIRRSRRRSESGCCPQCGYDLRASTDRCSECGWPNLTTASDGALGGPESYGD